MSSRQAGQKSTKASVLSRLVAVARRNPRTSPPPHTIRPVSRELYCDYRCSPCKQDIRALRFSIKIQQYAAQELVTTQLLSHPKHSDLKRLNRYEAQVFSQVGEDGIISEMRFKRTRCRKQKIKTQAAEGSLWFSSSEENDTVDRFSFARNETCHLLWESLICGMKKPCE